jgi:hypothetical protein
MAALQESRRAPEFLGQTVTWKTGLLRFAQGIREAETDHTIVFLVMIVITIYAAMNAWLALVGWLLLANTGANVYPIMLQRYKRARLLPVLERLGIRNDR